MVNVNKSIFLLGWLISADFVLYGSHFKMITQSAFTRTNVTVSAYRGMWVMESSALKKWSPLLTVACKIMEAVTPWPPAKTSITTVTHHL